MELDPGVIVNVGRAVTLYKEAAALDQKDAQYNLGICYLEGIGIAKDPKEGIKWLKKAAAAPSHKFSSSPLSSLSSSSNFARGEANFILGELIETGEDVDESEHNEDANKCDQAQTNEEKREEGDKERRHQKAMEYFEEAARLGNSEAKIKLALSHFYGNGVPQDLSRSYQLFQSAAKDGHPDGLYYTSISLLNGWGVTKDEKRGTKMMEKAREKGSRYAEEFIKHKEKHQK